MSVLKPVMTDTAEVVLEARTQRTKRLLEKAHDRPLLAVTLRIPLRLQNTPIVSGFFRHVVHQIKTLLSVTAQLETSPAGRCATFHVPHMEAYQLKQWAIFFEETHPLGALLDCDIITPQGPLKRHQLGEPLRPCYLCDEPALHCQRERTHADSVIDDYILKRLNHTLHQALLDAVIDALIDEVTLHPKFALVTPYSHGRHHDMTIDHFSASIEALKPYIKQFIDVSVEDAHAPHLKAIGQAAEAAMFKATGGVNTHKGAIFLFGWVLPFITQGIKTGQTLDEALKTMARVATPTLMDELQTAQKKPRTTGEAMFEQFGIQGVRGEIMQSLKSIRAFDLHAYDRHQRLTALMSVCDDTTLLKHHSLKTLKNVQQDTKALLDEWQLSTYEALSKRYLHHGISPGGAADLYSVWTFLLKVSAWLRPSLDASR